MARVVIGLGSGRCGTKSLAALFALQNGTASTHEEWPPVPWDATDFLVRHRMGRISSREGEVSADTAFYWLPHVRLVASDYPDSRFVCLIRDKGPCIESLLKQIGYGEVNPYQSRGPDGWYQDSLPTYDGVTLREAVSKYYDDYYIEAQEHADAMPSRFRIFDMDLLNSVDGVKEILAFCGYENPVAEKGIILNASR